MSKEISLLIDEGVKSPTYATPGSSGFDLQAVDIITAYKGEVEVDEEKLERMRTGFNARGYLKIRPFERVLFDTGITLEELPEELEIQIRSRSGITLKRGLVVLNSPGTIDSDYKNKIGVILYNSTPFLIQVNKDEKIAQGVICRVFKTNFEIENEEREGGFGSTD